MAECLVFALGLTARFAWENAGTRTAKAQLPQQPDVDRPEITKEAAVVILAADPGDSNWLDADDPCEELGGGVDGATWCGGGTYPAYPATPATSGRQAEGWLIEDRAAPRGRSAVKNPGLCRDRLAGKRSSCAARG